MIKKSHLAGLDSIKFPLRPNFATILQPFFIDRNVGAVKPFFENELTMYLWFYVKHIY